MASFCTLVVHKYHPRIYSARCKASCEPSLQGRWWLPWWPPSAWIASGQSPSKSRSLQFAWVCSVWCWLSSMKAGRRRGGHQTGRPSCDVPDAGSGRSSAGGWYYEKLLIIPIMTSISLWEVRNHLVLFVLIIQLFTILLLIKTLHNTVCDTAGNIHLAMHFYMNLLQKSLIMSIIWYYWPYHYEKLNGKVSTLSVWFSIQICDLLLIMFHLS